MSTGIENWSGKMAEIEGLYPFAGGEFIWWIIAVALWIIWQISCTRAESAQYKEEIAKHGNADSLASHVDRD